MNQYRILCFGDSITYGAWDEAGGGWADMLRQKLHSEYLEGGIKAQVFNLGIGAETSDGLLKRIENEILARAKSSWELAILIAIGANDTRAKVDPQNYEGDPDSYRDNIEKIISIASKYTNKVLMIGLHAVNEKLTFKDFYFTNSRFETFDQINTDLCLKHNIPKVLLHKELLKQSDFEEMYFDMVHPNHKGHKWIFEKILPEVKRLIGE
ncbi:MAG: GDSL-type esterase/lipase family protein [Patescibacteria group bacterium]